MALIKCKECGGEVSKKAEICPHCGAKQKRKTIGLFSAIILIIIVSSIANVIKESDQQERTQAKQQAELQKQTDYFNTNKTTIIDDIKKKIAANQYKNALIQLNAYKHTKNADLLKLYPTVKEHTILATLKTLPASQKSENLKLYKDLLTIKPESKKYKTKIAYYQGKIDADKAEAVTRTRKFGNKPEGNFSGGYFVIDKHLKNLAHDPDSINANDCSDVYYNNSGWLVNCTYRGKNTFGALTKNTRWFTINHGKVIKTEVSSAHQR